MGSCCSRSATSRRKNPQMAAFEDEPIRLGESVVMYHPEPDLMTKLEKNTTMEMVNKCQKAQADDPPLARNINSNGTGTKIAKERNAGTKSHNTCRAQELVAETNFYPGDRNEDTKISPRNKKPSKKPRSKLPTPDLPITCSFQPAGEQYTIENIAKIVAKPPPSPIENARARREVMNKSRIYRKDEFPTASTSRPQRRVKPKPMKRGKSLKGIKEPYVFANDYAVHRARQAVSKVQIGTTESVTKVSNGLQSQERAANKQDSPSHTNTVQLHTINSVATASHSVEPQDQPSEKEDDTSSSDKLDQDYVNQQIDKLFREALKDADLEDYFRSYLDQ